MSANSSSNPGTPVDDIFTVAAIAVLAFIIADLSHEVIGHGIGFLISGGRSGIFTTTRLMSTQRFSSQGDGFFDLGGPFGNLFFAACAWLAQRGLRAPAQRLRLLLWLSMAFNLFWGLGYLIYSGAFARGDWFALIRPMSHPWLGRVLLVVIGIVLYRAAISVVAAELRRIVSVDDANRKARLRRLILTAYFAGGVIACTGAVLDPQGISEIWNSGALASFAAAAGFFAVPHRFREGGQEYARAKNSVSRSYGWMVAAVVVSIFYIGVLGPGIRFSF